VKEFWLTLGEFFLGLTFRKEDGRLIVESIPIYHEIGQFTQNFIFFIVLCYGLCERFFLKAFFWEKYCMIVRDRLNNWDCRWLVKKVKERLEQFQESAPTFLHEKDKAARDLQEAAEWRVRSMKHLVFAFLINPFENPLSIAGYPDLAYELLIQDTAMWRFVQVFIFRFQLDHLPYYNETLTDFANESITSDRFMSSLIESIV
jgi:hypothetical protein